MRRTTLIVCIVAVVLLSAGIFILYTWSGDEPEQPQPEQPYNETVKVFVSEQTENITSIYFAPHNKKPFALLRDALSGEITLDAAEAIFPGDLFMMYVMFEQAITLNSLVCVIEEADNEQLDMLGFSNPVMSWRINRADGISIDIEVGAEQAAGQGRYVRRHDSREIFILTEMQQMILVQELEDIYDLSFLPHSISPNDELSLQTVNHIIIETEDSIIELRKRSDEEFANAIMGTSMYRIEQPVSWDSNDFIVQTIILENAARIVPDSVEVINPANLSVYGLDNPAKLTMSTGEWSGTLLIGDHDVEREGRYVMIEGHNAVLFDHNDVYKFLDISTAQLRSLLIWLHKIEDISTITFKLDDDTRILEFEHESSGTGISGWLDDNELSANNTRRLCASVFNITLNGETDATIPNIPPVYVFTIQFNDGSSEELALYQLNDSHYLIVLNGVNTGLFTTRMTLQQNLLSRFEILDAGGDIPML